MEKESKEAKRIITDRGLFYSNFDRFKFNLFLMPDSEYYSEHLVMLRDTYGIVIGEQQPDAEGNIHENTIGVYIEDYPRYLSDLDDKCRKTYTSDGSLSQDDGLTPRLR